ncbi:MAG: hypothetical protein HY711_08910 [Candidatus Melainabacteria bacterium]|nr:hypothetical protein [Candidatus Melainabacteria bacterium]
MPTICPVAAAVGCKQCLIVRVCLVKGLLGDYGAKPSPPSHLEPGEDDDPLLERKPTEEQPTYLDPDDDPLWRR